MNTSQHYFYILCLVQTNRAMGWRVRFVNAIDPIAQDLTVDHPLFSLGMKDIFHSIMKNNANKSKGKSSSSSHHRRSKGNTKVNKSGEDTLQYSYDYQNDEQTAVEEYPWVEILTLKSEERNEKKSRWIHVDPTFELVDEPLLVELIRGQKDSILKKGSSSLKLKGATIPVSYVVAVEPSPTRHSTFASSSSRQLKQLSSSRIVDVTPRYANKWSRTLRLRGATAKHLEKSRGKCSNRWWTKTIKKTNSYFSTKNTASGGDRKASPVKIEKNMKGEDILVLDDSSEDEKKSPLNQKDSSNDVNDDNAYDDDDSTEENEFNSAKANEAIPTSKSAFKNHPLYVIPSVLKNQEVLAPDAKKRLCGMFKGELVYKRNDVSTALPAKKWLYEGRKVREDEISNPVKKIKGRKKAAKKGFKALSSYGEDDASKTQSEILASSVANGDFEEKEDDKVHIYGRWQTDPWSPAYVGPNDEIPVNEHKNVELALINPGLVHLELHRISLVAKKLSIPYAPCLLGFEGHGGNRTPTIRGIVVHEHNEDLLRCAHTEYESQAVEDAYKKKQEEIYRRWRRLINGVLTTERLKREYGDA